MTNPLTIDAPAGQATLSFTREFDAPVEAVFDAHRDPALVQQWLGPHGYEMRIDTYEFATGGSYRYVHRNQGGDEFGFHGVFHCVRENEFAVQTFEFEGMPDVVSLDALTFVALEGGRCRLEGRSTFPSVEARDGMIDSGMEHGMSDGYERLDTLVAAKAAAKAAVTA